MTALEDASVLEPADRDAWRAWLESNHALVAGAWLVIPRRLVGLELDYEAAVEEALCFGWIDSTGGHLPDGRGKLYFARRKPRSVWAASEQGAGRAADRCGPHGTGRAGGH